MPLTNLFKKLNLTQLKVNCQYFKTIPGIIRLSELVIGIICFISIIVSSSSYYNPFLGTEDYGFAGGTVEIFFLLNIYACLLATFLITIATLTATTLSPSPLTQSPTLANSSSANKLSFCFIYHFTAFVINLINSLNLLIVITKRNRGVQIKEPGYGYKIVASVFGLLLSLCYLLSAMFTFRTSSLLSSDSDKNINYLASKCGVSVVTSGLGINPEAKFPSPSSPTRGSMAFLPAWVRAYITSANNVTPENNSTAIASPAATTTNTHRKQDHDNRASNIYDEISIAVPESTNTSST
ncbi:uncharacterized protein LOC128393475 isoform X2 [Panonychus citri]|uniref:uncharacterized protein LOC128393475 isoform X2 n=1 Tax=Panonychus citri TaxID=50023 RepID=UPI002308250D|nr:uncharacterized protein LOC128393475 isoform X2 [Panonychus citri]